MKFLIDADCPRSLGAGLKAAGHDVVDIRDLRPHAADEAIYELIQLEARILVTRDTDFSNLLRYPPTARCGIILLRVALLSTPEQLAILKDFLSGVTDRDLVGSLSVLRRGRYRIHRL